MHRVPRLLAAALPAALVAATAALVGAAPATGGAQPTESGPTAAPVTERRRVDAGIAARSAAAALQRASARAVPRAAIARVDGGATVDLRSHPGGPVSLSVGDATEFGSPRALGVAARRGRWLGVTAPELPNGRLGWIDRRTPGVTLARTRWSIVVDVSDRRTVLRRAGRPVRRLDVAVGRPGSATPTGRFAVTDKLSGSRFGPYYGCCILAISATQPNTPPGWTGGDRMAIHGTDDPGSIGQAASAGCLRAADGDLRVLMDSVPLGTPVIIRR